MWAMGTRGASLVRAPNLLPTPLILNLLLLAFASSYLVVSFASPDGNALLKFKDSLTNADALSNWDPSTDPCTGNWTGVVCFKGQVVSLLLGNRNLTGKVDVDALVPLSQLWTLDISSNKFEGPLPDFKKLVDIKGLFLANNQFSGVIPDDTFEGMNNLRKVSLSNNNFTGKTPSSLTALSKLVEVRLEDNQFEGDIPEFQSQELKMLNVSNNLLEGPIPPGLAHIDETAFAGLKVSKSPPAPAASSKTPATPAATKDAKTPSKDADPKAKSAATAAASKAGAAAKKKSPMTAIIIVIVVVIVIAVIGVLVFMYMKKNKKAKEEKAAAETPPPEHRSVEAPPPADANKAEPGKASPEADGAGSSRGSRRGENAKLLFVREDREKFELQDLLNASAEVLGSGNFGSSYKALLKDGKAMVVKRFKQMEDIDREAFYEHMKRIGKLSHPNLLPLVAYYYRKEEKLLVYDYIPNRSLANQLHGNRHVEQVKLDWPARLKIVKGIAKGLDHLHTELPTLSLPHGHLKSSNVLLSDSLDSLLMDYSLVPLVNLEKAQQILVGYKCPEFVQQFRLTNRTDVWCLGILILEILTGKSPPKSISKSADSPAADDLSSWIHSIKEDNIQDVVDEKMGETSNAKGEIQKLLKIAKACCEENVDLRLDLKEAVEKIEGIKAKDSSDDTKAKGLTDDAKAKDQSDAAKDKDKADDTKSKDQTDAVKSKGQSDAAKDKEKSDAATSKDQTDAAKSKDQSDAAKDKDKSDATKSKDQTDGAKDKDTSDANKSKDQTDAAKGKDQVDASKSKDQAGSDKGKDKDQGDPTKAKDQTNADKVKDQTEASKAKDQSDAAKVDVKG